MRFERTNGPAHRDAPFRDAGQRIGGHHCTPHRDADQPVGGHYGTSHRDVGHRTAVHRDADRISRIQANYGRWARFYDWFARATAGLGGVRAGSIAALDVGPGDTVVEFGCGPGVNLPAIREPVGATGQVVGVDVTRPMLERARALVARRGWDNVSVVQADAATPPIAAADAVLATFVTSLFSDPYAVVRRWCEVADRVVLATFAPRGNRAANAALWAFTQVNPPLFEVSGREPLDQLEERTAESRRALADAMDAVDTTEYVFRTITVNAGYRES